MPNPASGALHGARAVALAVVVVLLTLVSHLAAHGDAPPVVPVLAVTALVAAWLLPLLRRPASMRRLVVIAGLGQLCLHHAFEYAARLSSGASHTVGTTSVGMTPMDMRSTMEPGASMHLVAPMDAATGSSVSTLAMPGGSAMGVPMIAAHVVATLAVAALLAHHDTLLWRLWSWLRPLRSVPAIPATLPDDVTAAPHLTYLQVCTTDAPHAVHQGRAPPRRTPRTTHRASRAVLAPCCP